MWIAMAVYFVVGCVLTWSLIYDSFHANIDAWESIIGPLPVWALVGRVLVFTAITGICWPIWVVITLYQRQFAKRKNNQSLSVE